MRISKAAVTACLLLAASAACAHEFWLEPLRFLLQRGDSVRVELMVGEDYTGEHSNGHRLRINRLDHYSAAGTEDIRSRLSGDSLDHIAIVLNEAGNHLIALGNAGKVMSLEAAKFNDYLRSEGLDDAMALRIQRGDTLKPGRELFRRCAKTLFQAGDRQDKTFAVNTGLRLEIIPELNPYAVKSEVRISFKVLFDNKPVKGTLVLAWHSVNGKTVHTSLRSDGSGRVIFPISRTGKWMISTVHMIAAADSTQSDWESYWGSYTFGYF